MFIYLKEYNRRKKRRFISFAVAIGIGLTIAVPSLVAQEVLLLKNGTIVNPATGKSATGISLLVRDGLISAIGQNGYISEPNNTVVIDVAGKWIIPGLIDVHTHTADHGVLRRALALGVTTVHSMPPRPNTTVTLEDESLNPNLAISRVLVTNPLFTGEAPDHVMPGVYFLRKPATVEEARRQVNDAYESGFRRIKVLHDDDRLWSGDSNPLPVLSPEILDVISDEAHELGMQVFFHAWRLNLLREMLESGAKYPIHPVADRSLKNPDWAALREAGASWVTTMTLLVSLADPSDYVSRLRNDSLLWNSVPQGTKKQLLQRASASGDQLAGPFPSLIKNYDSYLENVQSNTRTALSNGLPLALGSDGIPGRDTHIEAKLLQETGLKPQDVLRAGTIGGAELLGLQDQIGTIEIGKRADLLVLSDDPTQDVRNLLRIKWVIKGGEPYSIDELISQQ